MNTALNNMANHSHSMELFKVQPRFAQFSYAGPRRVEGHVCLYSPNLAQVVKLTVGTVVKSNE